jgi:DNA-binding MarR family transcriptional regulator
MPLAQAISSALNYTDMPRRRTSSGDPARTDGSDDTDGPRDSVDRLLASWASAAPDLDLAPVAIIARLGRLRQVIAAELEATFAQHGLNGPDFAALVTLRRLDQPDGVPQSRLMRELNLTSGTISARVERLVSRGLAYRMPDQSDHRNSRLRLTDAGLRLFEKAAPAHAATEDRLLAALDDEQRAHLADLLRRLLVSFEGSTAEGGTPRLGLSLAPAHGTLEFRRAAGLPEVLGLLVREVEPGTPAARADIRLGDVLVTAEGEQLRSVTTLHAAAKRARRSGALRVSLVRGVDTSVEAVIDVRDADVDGDPLGRPSTADSALHAI